MFPFPFTPGKKEQSSNVENKGDVKLQTLLLLLLSLITVESHIHSTVALMKLCHF